MRHQRVIAYVAALGATCPAHEVLVVAGHARLKHLALHRDGAYAAVALYEGPLLSQSLCKVRRPFSRNIALHFLPCQLSARPVDLHPRGAHGLAVNAQKPALALGLDPVEQRLINHPQCSGHRCNALSTLDWSDRLLLEFERVRRPMSSSFTFLPI